MVSRLVNRNVSTLSGRTSIRLEPEFWEALRDICLQEDIDLRQLMSQIDQTKHEGGRTSAVRVFILEHFRRQDPAGARARAPVRAERANVLPAGE
jgi:predicted DNA-binding ribbon-helix-helix protein